MSEVKPAIQQVLALAREDASLAAARYADGAARAAVRRVSGRDLDSVGPCAWPAFHARMEALWPALDGRGHLQGTVDLVLRGHGAQALILPVQGRDGALMLARVDLGHPAVVLGERVQTLGLSGCDVRDVEFSGVPSEVLGAFDAAADEALLADLVPMAMALLCGVAQASLAQAHEHVAQRHQGGGPMQGWGEVRRLLSGMQERVSAMQGLLSSAASSGEASVSSAVSNAGPTLAAQLLHVGRLACEVTVDGVQLLGAAGTLQDHPQAQRLRDARQLHGLLGGVAWRRQQGWALTPMPGCR
ncbi:MAG: hypothetical protein I8H88_00400 [Burkholderiales bacterium]|nr:hypothetical protein [Burkholderiales bacterium]